MQSIYTASIVNQIVEDRLEDAARARRAPRRRGLFRRGERRAAPLSAHLVRPRVSGAGR